MKLNPYDGYFWQGETVRLRPLRKADAQKKWREWTDTHARRLLEYQLDLPPVSYEAYEADLEDACEFKDTSKRISFGVETLDGEFVGWINLFKGGVKNGTFALGAAVFREYRQKGYGAEAIRIVLRYAFRELRMHKCNTECLAINEGSIRLQTKLGFVEEGRRRETVFMDGKHHDILLFGMTKAEFEATEGR